MISLRIDLSLALLVSNCAGSLAGRLAGSLAVTAAALSSSLLEISLIDSLNMLHIEIPPTIILINYITHSALVF